MIKPTLLLVGCWLLMSITSLMAQSAAYFDGVDDHASVQYDPDFDFGKNDLTFEVMLQDVPKGKNFTILSKRTGKKNGFCLYLNTKKGRFTAQLGKKKHTVTAPIIRQGGCLSLAVKRENKKVTLFVNGIVYPSNNNNKNISRNTALLIGEDGANNRKPFKGRIDEVRIWDIARKNQDIINSAGSCLSGTEPNLVAYWNMEENKGQFFHDLTTNQHHAPLGNSFNVDLEDPIWFLSKCMKNCCETEANFTVSNHAPYPADLVNFNNTSTLAASYEWSVNGQVVGTSTNLQHSFSMGISIVTLKATGKGGCSSYHSEVVEVTKSTYSYCGEEEFVSEDVKALENFENANPHPNPYPTIKMYDRFGNRYLPHQVTVPLPVKSSGSTPTSCGCGIFELHFEDMMDNRDYGFDDPVLGADRRAVACRVFEDLSLLVNPSGTLPNNLVQIQVKKSEGKATHEANPIDELDPGVLAVAGPYIITGYTTGIIDGLVYKTITSGSNAIASTPGWNPNSYHGSLRVDFELPNFFLNNSNWTANAPANQMDLYSTLLHESLHILGFFSLIDAENNTNLSKINGTQLYTRYDTYLENAAGTPYIDPITGILNPASAFNGTSNCAADVVFQGNSNPNQSVYRPAPWNFSILSHFNCTAGNNQGCAVNNGYIMNACIAPGEMQRAPNQAEYSTLCDIGYQLGTSYGNAAVGTPANNIPYQTYTSCTPSCAVAGIDDDLTSTLSFTAGTTTTINASSFLTNDNNTGGSYNLSNLLSDFGAITNITTSGFDFTPDPTIAGTAIIQYTPTCANGNNGSSALIFITVNPIVLPCNLPASACNLLCNGDLEQTIYNSNGNGSQNNIDNFQSYYVLPSGMLHPNFGGSSDLYEYDNAGNLTSFAPSWLTASNGIYTVTDGCEPGFGNNFGGFPLPVDFANGKRSYVGLGVWSGQWGEHITLSLNQGLTPSATDNYRLGFWAFTLCDDIDVRMALSENPPCPGIGSSNDPFSNVYDPISAYTPVGAYPPAFQNNCGTYTVGSNQGLTPSATFDMGAPVNSTDGWEYFTMDFHVTNPNLDEVIFSMSTSNPASNQSKYILIDEITIEPLVPQLTITPTIVGTPCPNNTIVIEYNICADIPVSGVDLHAQLPIASGLTYTNDLDFTNGQISGLDLGVGGNPLCTLLRLEIEIPNGASTPSTQSVFLDVAGGAACTSTASNLNTDINITAGTNLSVSVVPSITAPQTVGSSFTVDVIVSNTGGNDVQNIMVDLPTGNHSTGLSYSFTPTNLGTITAGGQQTITGVPVSVVGPCGNAQICAEVTAADGSCNLPAACSPVINIIGTGNITFPIQMDGFPTNMATSNNGDIYATGILTQDITFTSGTSSNTLTYTGTSSAFNVFVVKYSSCGFEWAREIPTQSTALSLQNSPDIEVASNGDVFVSFIFNSNFSTYTNNGGQDIGIAKFDNAGTLEWITTDGGPEDDLVVDLEIDESGAQRRIVLGGYIKGTGAEGTANSNFASIAGSSFAYHNEISNNTFRYIYGSSYVASYLDGATSATGDWARLIDQPSNSAPANFANYVPTIPSKISIDPAGNVYFAGLAYEDFAFANKNNNSTGYPNSIYGTSATGDIDAFALSYTSNGVERWATFYGDDAPSSNFGGGEASRIGIDMDLDGGLLYLVVPFSGLTTWSTHIVAMNTTLGTIGSNAPLTTNSAYLLHSNLAVDNNGNPIVSGNYYLSPNNNTTFSTADFYPSSANGQSVTSPTDQVGWFIEKFDGNANFQWVLPNTSIVPAISSDEYLAAPPLDIEIGTNGDIYNCILVQGDITLNGGTFGPTLTNSIAYIVRVQDQGSSGIYAKVSNNNNNTAVIDQSNQVLSSAQISKTKTINTKLYPNPTTGKITLEIASNLEQHNVEKITIYTVTGLIVQDVTIEDATQQKFEIDLHAQSSGVYFIKLLVDNEVITKQVILNK